MRKDGKEEDFIQARNENELEEPFDMDALHRRHMFWLYSFFNLNFNHGIVVGDREKSSIVLQKLV